MPICLQVSLDKVVSLFNVILSLHAGVGSKDPDGGVIGLKRPLDELPHAPKRPRRSTSNQVRKQLTCMAVLADLHHQAFVAWLFLLQTDVTPT